MSAASSQGAKPCGSTFFTFTTVTSDLPSCSTSFRVPRRCQLPSLAPGNPHVFMWQAPTEPSKTTFWTCATLMRCPTLFYLPARSSAPARRSARTPLKASPCKAVSHTISTAPFLTMLLQCQPHPETSTLLVRLDNRSTGRLGVSTGRQDKSTLQRGAACGR